MEFNDSDNNLDYNVVITYAWEESTLRPIIAAIKP